MPVSVRGSVSAGASTPAASNASASAATGIAAAPSTGSWNSRRPGASSQSAWPPASAAYTSAISCRRASRSRSASTEKRIDSAAHVTASPVPDSRFAEATAARASEETPSTRPSAG